MSSYTIRHNCIHLSRFIHGFSAVTCTEFRIVCTCSYKWIYSFEPAVWACIPLNYVKNPSTEIAVWIHTSKRHSTAYKVVNLPVYRHIPILCTEYICTKSQIFHSSWSIFGGSGENSCKKKADCNSLIPGDLYLGVGLFIFPPKEKPQQTYLSVSLLQYPSLTPVIVHVWQMALIISTVKTWPVPKILPYCHDLSAGRGFPCSRKTSAGCSSYFKFTLYHISRQKGWAKPVVGKAFHTSEKVALDAICQY